MNAVLEHVNLTVTDADAFAGLLGRLFGWHERWRGPIEGGRAVHVGTRTSYIALFQFDAPLERAPAQYSRTGAMNHMAFTVDDLDAMEARVRAEGLPVSRPAAYEPGRRFYTFLPDDIEVEIVSYAPVLADTAA